MTFLIRQISHTADGREIIRQSTLPKPQLSVGRAAENDIHLQDLSVTPDHARIEQIDARRVRVRATGTLGFSVDGRNVTHADIDAVAGAELRFGGHRITISHGEGDEIILSVQRVDAVSDASTEKDEARVFSLAGLLPGRRSMAWAFAISILIGFLAIPIFSYVSRPAQDTRNIYAVKGERQAQIMQASLTKGDHVTGDAAWSPGPLSQAHHAMEGKCESCHVKAFVSVQDSACQTCHNPAEVHEHAPAARIAMARAAPGLEAASLQASRPHSANRARALASIATPNMKAPGQCSPPRRHSAPTAMAVWTSASRTPSSAMQGTLAPAIRNSSPP
ncbi:MAG: FHA domain-containing protein [Sphingobium sp.]